MYGAQFIAPLEFLHFQTARGQERRGRDGHDLQYQQDAGAHNERRRRGGIIVRRPLAGKGAVNGATTFFSEEIPGRI